MLESGIITENVEKFVAINVKMSADVAQDLAAIMAELQSSGVDRMFGPHGEDVIHEFTVALTTVVIQHAERVNEAGEYLSDDE